MEGQTLPCEQARRWKNNAKKAASEASRWQTGEANAAEIGFFAHRFFFRVIFPTAEPVRRQVMPMLYYHKLLNDHAFKERLNWLLRNVVYYALQGISRFLRRLWKKSESLTDSSCILLWYCLLYCRALILKCKSFTWKLLRSIFLWKCLLQPVPFESVDKILRCEHSNESYWAVLSCGAPSVYYAVQGGSTFWVCG